MSQEIPALEARGLGATLGNTEVLHGIDLKLGAARWTSVVGPNGAGKSTLLKALAGLLAHRGEVFLLAKHRPRCRAAFARSACRGWARAARRARAVPTT